MNEKVLLTAGQSNLSKCVKNAIGKQVVSSFSDEYKDSMIRISHNLIKVFGANDKYMAFPVLGSGTAAMEATIASVTNKNTRVLVCANGFFGHRMSEIASIYSNKVDTYSVGWGEPFSYQEFECQIQKTKPDVVCVVHGETSVGIKNPVKELCAIAKKYSAVTLVDCSTTLVGCSVRISDWNIDIAFSVSQKCIGMCPGVSPVILNKEIYHNIIKKNTCQNYYLNLSRIVDAWYPKMEYHYTPSITLLFGLDAALNEIVEYGLENRINFQVEMHKKLKNILKTNNFDLLINNLEYELETVVSIIVPYKSKKLQKFLFDRDILVSGGYGNFEDHVLRIGLLSLFTVNSDLDKLDLSLKLYNDLEY